MLIPFQSTLTTATRCHEAMKTRRTSIAAILFALGVAVYLIASDAPLRVHVVTIAVEFCLLAAVTLFLTATSMKMTHRLVGIVLSVGVLALVSTWLASKVIAALNPIEPRHFAGTLVWFGVQALLFSGGVLAIDFAIAHRERDVIASPDR